jgi:hypothetical protein
MQFFASWKVSELLVDENWTIFPQSGKRGFIPKVLTVCSQPCQQSHPFKT